MAPLSEPLPPSEGPPRRRWRTVLGTVLKWVLFVVVLVVVGRVLVERFGEVSWSQITFRPMWLAGALLVTLLALGVGFVPYGLVVGHLGYRPPLLAVMVSLWVAQVGKYLPGKVGSVVGVVWLLRRHRVPMGVSAGAVVMIDGLSVILGMLMAIPLTLSEPVRARFPMAWLWCLLLVVAGVVCLHPRVFGWLCNMVLRRLRQEPLRRLPRIRDLGWPMLALFGQYCLAGFCLWMLARSFTDVGAGTLPLLTSVATLAATVGFLSFFAPGGLGVQEGALIILLDPFIGSSNAAILAVASRFIKTAGEALLAGAGLAMIRWMPSLGPSSSAHDEAAA